MRHELERERNSLSPRAHIERNDEPIARAFHLVNVGEFTDRWQMMRERAHAKINLSLRILGRRDDGFHEIESTLVPVALHDSLTIEASKGFQFACDDPSLPAGQENLVVRAADVFFHETKAAANVSIALHKRIPHGAGLGGGSSDAAATLRGLNRLFGKALSATRLMALAQAIGSDVPFFLHQGAAICRGRGEIVQPIDSTLRLNLLLLKPGFGVATACAYSQWSHAHALPGGPYSAQQFQGRTFVNDLERPVFEKFSVLAVMKAWLLEQPEIAVALMSGSGSTLFAVLKATADAQALATRAREEMDADLWVCPTATL